MNPQDLICGGSEGKAICAKSNPLVTLDEHTEDCMHVMDMIKESLPLLSQITIFGEMLWEMLFISIVFHDVGKAAKGFQDMLISGRKYKFRHERLSGAVFEQAAHGIPQDCKDAILRVILTHHKACEDLKDILDAESFRDEEFDLIFGEENVMSFSTEALHLDYPRMNLFLNKMASLHTEKYTGNFMLQLERRSPLKDVLKQEINRIYPLDKLSDKIFSELILWGLLKACDHMGSSKIRRMPLILPEHQSFLKKINKGYAHQMECWSREDNVLLIAPTGSGKTEAAFGWAFNIISHSQHRHIFYILPYTASINAMFYRLNNAIDNGKEAFSETTVVGLVHGKLRQFAADSFDENSYDGKQLREVVESFRALNKPIKITTPFQILKYLFGVKGFEKGLTELAGAILIYDEIHAYDKELFLKILWSLEWFQKYFKIKVFVTTATLPAFLQNQILQTLGSSLPVKADPLLLKAFTRHRVKIHDGTIEESMDLIIDEIVSGKKVLVVCNTVDKAQLVYNAVKTYVEEKEIALLHSRFTYKDRNAIEKKILEEMSKVKVLIGTQAIEVSLDIDYDVAFSEPAPLDALLQRFGRVNRKRIKGICQVNVFSMGGPYDRKVYDEEIVKATVELLRNVERCSGGIIYEDTLQEMMNKIYKPWNMEDDDIQVLKRDFLSMMERLLPYKEHRITEEEFEKQFQTVEVVPRHYYEQYLKFVEERNFIQAEMLTCQLHKSKLYQPKVREKLLNLGKGIKGLKDIWLIDCKYDEKTGLIFSENEFVDNFI